MRALQRGKESKFHEALRFPTKQSVVDVAVSLFEKPLAFGFAGWMQWLALLTFYPRPFCFYFSFGQAKILISKLILSIFPMYYIKWVSSEANLAL